MVSFQKWKRGRADSSSPDEKQGPKSGGRFSRKIRPRIAVVRSGSNFCGILDEYLYIESVGSILAILMETIFHSWYVSTLRSRVFQQPSLSGFKASEGFVLANIIRRRRSDHADRQVAGQAVCRWTQHTHHKTLFEQKPDPSVKSHMEVRFH